MRKGAVGSNLLLLKVVSMKPRTRRRDEHSRQSRTRRHSAPVQFAEESFVVVVVVMFFFILDGLLIVEFFLFTFLLDLSSLCLQQPLLERQSWSALCCCQR